jgi:hypothetical protein
VRATPTPGRARTARRYRLRTLVTTWLAVIVVVALSVAHGAGVVGLSQAVRLGVAIVGALAVILVAGIVRDESDPPPELPSAVRRARPRPRVERWASSLAMLASRRRRAVEEVRRRADVAGEWAGMEQIVRFSESSAMDFHVRLRPRVSAVVRRRIELAGIDPSDTARVTEALGPLGPPLVHMGARPPQDRHAPGVPAAAVRDVLRRAEELM